MTDRALDAIAEIESRFEDKIMDLEARVDELEDENEQLREENEQLRERVDELEDEPGVEIRGDGDEVKDLWVAGLPIGPGIENRKEEIRENKNHVIEVDERVTDIERGEIDPGEVVAESTSIDTRDLLPLHQKYTAAKNLEPQSNGLTNNQEIAARCFPYLAEKAFNDGHGTLVLPSTSLREIIENKVYSPELARRLDVENPNPNTVRRVVGFIEDFAAEIVDEVDRDTSPTRIKIDREAWLSYAERVSQHTEDAASASGGEDYAVVMSD